MGGLPGVLGGMTRPGADVREAEVLQELADRPLVVLHAETLVTAQNPLSI